MREIPECLSQRYKALDEIIREITTDQTNNSDANTSINDPGIKLMCDFWDILKEDPDINLTQAVQQRMGVKSADSGLFGSNHVRCYRAGCCNNDDKKQEILNKPKRINDERVVNHSKCCASKSPSQATTQSRICGSKSPSQGTTQSLPLNKVLCNIKEVVSFEKKCQEKVSQLLETQKQLQDQIQVLEQREKDGMQLLKQADCMWSCMEETYKKKIAESLERQKGLLKQLKDVEASNVKWRKNKKDLEFQMDNVNKCHQEIIEKINEKTSDLKCIDMEIENFKNRIQSNKKDLESAKKSVGTKKQASDAKLANIAANVSRLENVLKEEQKHKNLKEQEGTKYIKEAREELQKLCKVLLQKKLENEDMKAEKEALLLELDLLNQNFDQCKDKCKNKAESVDDEIKSIDKEIADFQVKCIQCHECTDTTDIRKFCTDCPRCVEERNCLLEDDHCNYDHSMDCVCMTIKQRFLDNVFDNMYTILESQVQTGPGKAVAQEVLNCLKKSRNGKLNSETRKILQDFILTTVKRNLNLTIVGGAVKTRCEMDQETYNQLMLCLKKVKVTKPATTDKGTNSKKEPCRRWGGSSECHCPRGPKECICTKKALPPRGDPTPCPPQPEDKEDAGQVIACPHKDSTPCGPDCAMHALPNSVGSEVASWRPSPCQAPTCQFKNMRAAQCVLGPDPLNSFSGSMSLKAASQHIPDMPILGDEIAGTKCICGAAPITSCVCHKDIRGDSRERIIEEVLGRYTEVAPIEKVFTVDEHGIWKPSRERERDNECICRILYAKSINSSVTFRTASSKGYLNQMKVKMNVTCDKETCTFNWKLLNNVERNKDIVKMLDIDIPVKEKKMSVKSNDDKIDDSYPTFSETSAGDFENNILKDLGNNILKGTDNNIQENPNKFKELKETSLGKSLEYLKIENVLDHTKKDAKISPSANVILEIDKKYGKKCGSHFITTVDKENCYRNKTKGNNKDDIDISNYQCCSKGQMLSCKSLTKLLLNTANEIKRNCKVKDRLKTDKDIYKIKVKGVRSNDNELSFAIKCTTPGIYEIILDKEFEKWYKQTIKGQEKEYVEEYASLSKSESGQFIMNFGNNNLNDLNSKNAILVRSDSGNIKVKVHEHKLGPLSVKQDSESILSPRALSQLLWKLPCSSNEFSEGHARTSRYITKKSSSDSNLYERVKFNFLDNPNIEPEGFLKKSSSGQYTVVLDKECKKGIINNLKHYLSSSSKGLIPIKCSPSGNIIVHLNKAFSSKYGSLKITPSGNMYVALDKNNIKSAPNTDNVACKNNVLKKSKRIQNPDTVKEQSSKAVTTTCNTRCKENCCDEYRCVCKNLCYKSKQWFLKNSETKNNTKRCGVSNSNIENSLNSLISDNTIVIKNNFSQIQPCECRPILEKSSKEYSDRDIKPYCHQYRNSIETNNVLEISDLWIRMESKSNDLNERDSKIKNSPVNIENNAQWDSLKFLPPQLPPFLKDMPYL